MNHPFPRLYSPCHLGSTNISKYILDLHKLQHTTKKLMTGILKDFNLANAYMDDIIIFSRTVEEQLDHMKQVFEKLRRTHLSMKLSKCYFLMKEIQYLGHILSSKGIRPLPLQMQAIKNMHPPKMPKQVCAFLGLVGYYRKFIRNFAKIAKPLTLLTH